MKLGRRRKCHKGQAALRLYANLREPSNSLCFKLYIRQPSCCCCLASTSSARGVWRLATNIPTSHPTNKIKRSVIWSDNLLRKMQDYTEQDGVGVLSKQIWRRKNKQADVPNHDIAVKHKIPGKGCTSYLFTLAEIQRSKLKMAANTCTTISTQWLFHCRTLLLQQKDCYNFHIWSR